MQSWGGPFSELESFACKGSTGDILLLWDKRRINMVDSVVGSFLVSCLFRMAEDGYHQVFSEVYGLVEKSLRKSFWEELGSIKGL